MTRTLARAAPFVLAIAVAACAPLAVRSPPSIDVVSVSLDRVDGADAYFGVDVLLTNRVAEEIVVAGLQGSLSIEGESIAQAVLDNVPLHIPPNGTAHAEMTAHTGMDAVLRAAAAAMRSGSVVPPGSRPTLHYTIAGSATLAGGARFPFERRGAIGERR